MATEVASIYAKIGADTSDLKRGLGEAKTGMEGFGKTIAGIATAIASAFVVKAVINFGKEVVGMASDMEETVSKVGVVFEEQTQAVMDWSKNAATAMGMSRQEALAAAATYGNLFTALGLTEEQSAGMSMEMVQLASDLASFNNIDPTVALDKLRAGLTGETEPLKSLGINLNQDAIKAEAMAEGLMGINDEMTPAIKAQASYRLILKQSVKAQGDFERTSQGLANQQRITTAVFKDLKITLGTALLPMVNKVALAFSDFLIKNMPAIESVITAVGTWLAGAFEKVWNWIGKAWEVGKNFVDVMGAVFGDIASGDVGLAIDDFFEGFYDQLTAMGVNVPAAKVFVDDLVTTFQGLAGGLDAIANGNAPTLWAKLGVPESVTKSVQWLFTIFGDLKGIVQTAIAGLNGANVWDDAAPQLDQFGNLTQGASGLKSQLEQMGRDMLGWVVQGLTDFATVALNFSTALLAWANDPATQKGLSDFGLSLGTDIGEFLKSALTSKGTTDSVGTGIADMLIMTVTNLADTLITVGGMIGARLVQGIIQSLVPGGDASGIGNTLADFFTNYINAWTGTYPGGMMGLLSDTMNKLMKSLDSLNIKPLGAANGFDGMVTQPTLFLAGERGSEHVQVTPHGKTQGGIMVNVYASDARTAGDSVVAALRRKGYA